MIPFLIFRSPPPDITALKVTGNVPALIRLLRSDDLLVQRQSAEALEAMGGQAVPLLIEAVHSRAVPVRLGAIEALAGIKDPRAESPLINAAACDRSTEVRYAAILALGEIGSDSAVQSLKPFLQDPVRYVRYGAAVTLEKLGWRPPDDEAGRALFLIAKEDWEAVRLLGSSAIPHLVQAFRDPDPVTREAIIAVLGHIGGGEAHSLCEAALRDRAPAVRWRGVLASMDCGLTPHKLPILAAARERTGPDPAAAAILNFLFLGIGYNYIGKWWGFPVFMTYMSILVLAQLALGPFLPYLIAYPLTAIAGVHTYYLAEKISDL